VTSSHVLATDRFDTKCDGVHTMRSRASKHMEAHPHTDEHEKRPDSEFTPPPEEQSDTTGALEVADLGQLALTGGEDMASTSSAHRQETASPTPASGDVPRADTSTVSEELAARYRQNFALASSLAKQRKGVGLDERYVRERLRTYLRWHFDPRPFERIEAEYRSIVMSDLNDLRSSAW
jgi:hypothetical protein